MKNKKPKNKSSAITAILNSPASVFVVDSDAATSRAIGDLLRAEGDRVMAIDPFKVLDEITHAVQRGASRRSQPPRQSPTR